MLPAILQEFFCGVRTALKSGSEKRIAKKEKKGMQRDLEKKNEKTADEPRQELFENMQREIRRGKREVTKDTVLTLFIKQLMP